MGDGHGYSIAKGQNSLVVRVNNEPRPVVLTMGPDGGLLGPGPVDVNGKVISGYHTVTERLYVNGQPAAGPACGGPCTNTISVPDYAPKIERCTIGSLNPPPLKAAPEMDFGVVGLLMGVGDAAEPPPLPGLRMRASTAVPASGSTSARTLSSSTAARRTCDCLTPSKTLPAT